MTNNANRFRYWSEVVLYDWRLYSNRPITIEHFLIYYYALSRNSNGTRLTSVGFRDSTVFKLTCIGRSHRISLANDPSPLLNQNKVSLAKLSSERCWCILLDLNVNIYDTGVQSKLCDGHGDHGVMVLMNVRVRNSECFDWNDSRVSEIMVRLVRRKLYSTEITSS